MEAVKAAVSKVATGQARPATRQVAGGEIIPPEANSSQGGMAIAIPPFSILDFNQNEHLAPRDDCLREIIKSGLQDRQATGQVFLRIQQ